MIRKLALARRGILACLVVIAVSLLVAPNVVEAGKAAVPVGVSGCAYKTSTSQSSKFTTVTVTAKGSDRCTISVSGGVLVTIDYGIVDSGGGPIGAVEQHMTVGSESFTDVQSAVIVSNPSCQGKIQSNSDRRRCERRYSTVG